MSVLESCEIYCTYRAEIRHACQIKKSKKSDGADFFDFGLEMLFPSQQICYFCAMFFAAILV